MSELTTEKFIEAIQYGAKKVGEEFTKPDEDWAPVVQIEEGDGAITTAQVDPRFFSSDHTREIFVSMIGQVLQQMQARKIAFINSAWLIRTTEARLENKPRPNDHPDREECVLMFVISKDEAHSFIAMIERDGENPPTLGEWENNGEFDSRFLDWQEALA